MSWARWNGLVRKSVAPSFIAFTASSTVPKAVSMMKSTSGAAALTLGKQLEPGEAGHLQVRQDQIDAALLQAIEGALPVGRQHDGVALARERALEAFPHRRIVVRDQQRRDRSVEISHGRTS